MGTHAFSLMDAALFLISASIVCAFVTLVIKNQVKKYADLPDEVARITNLLSQVVENTKALPEMRNMIHDQDKRLAIVEIQSGFKRSIFDGKTRKIPPNS